MCLREADGYQILPILSLILSLFPLNPEEEGSACPPKRK
jgi:hypothetical protein